MSDETKAVDRNLIRPSERGSFEFWDLGGDLVRLFVVSKTLALGIADEDKVLLGQAEVKALLPLLAHYAETGRLPEGPEPQPEPAAAPPPCFMPGPLTATERAEIEALLGQYTALRLKAEVGFRCVADEVHEHDGRVILRLQHPVREVHVREALAEYLVFAMNRNLGASVIRLLWEVDRLKAELERLETPSLPQPDAIPASEALGRRVRGRRVELGLTVGDLAERLLEATFPDAPSRSSYTAIGNCRAAVVGLESGASGIGAGQLGLWAKILEVEVAWFGEGES